MLIMRVRHDWPEKADYGIDYGPKDYYSFFHFPIPFYIQVRGEVVLCKPNSCIFVPPGAPRYFHCYEASAHNFMFLKKDVAPLLREYQIPEDALLCLSNAAFISDIFQRMELEFYSDSPYKEAMLDAYLREFLIKLSRGIHVAASVEVSIQEQMKLRNVRHEVLSQCEKKWTVAEMAALASLSPSRFHALYSAMFGTTPIGDLTIAKIDYARTLLRAKEYYSIQEITDMVGYQSQCHFINKFKKIKGITPHQYRKKFR